jgi:DNA excision repair protein ERCC-4
MLARPLIVLRSRQIEIYSAVWALDGRLRVYTMMYASSLQEQKFLTSLRVEKAAFESLIATKAHMAVSVDQVGFAAHPE